MNDILLNQLDEKIPVPGDFVLVFDVDGYANKAKVENLPAGGGGSGAITLTAPTLSAAGIDADTIRLTIGAVSNEIGIEIQRSNDGSTGWSTISSSPADTTTYDDNGISASTARSYRVRSLGNGTTYLTSAWSSVATASTTASGGGGYDTDAEAFFTYKGITNTTIKDAINAHVLDLKNTIGIWGTKITRIWPFVGGTGSAHAGDLRNPSSGFDLAYNGAPTHSANGMECAATSTDCAKTNVVPSASMDIADLSMGVYVRQDEQVSSLDKMSMGVQGVNFYTLSIVPRFTNDQAYFGMTDSGGNVSPANTVASGFYSISRTANNVGKAFKNGAQVGSTFTGVQTTLPNTNEICIGGGRLNDGSYISGENQICYAFIGKGLTDSEMLAYYNSIQTLQTALSRAV